MSIDQYRGKECEIKATGLTGRIEDVLRRKNQHNQITVRYLVNRPDGSQGEYLPHEIEIDLTSVVPEQTQIAETLNSEDEHTRETNTGT